MRLLPASCARGRGSAFFTGEDAKTAFNMVCCVCGIGSLGMPSNYARAGPLFATIALLFMAFANIYATVALSRVMLAAPSSVKTYGDLGRWAMGRTGYYLVVISHMGVCLLTPCAFLVLGGQLLDVLFPGAFSQPLWTGFMAVLVVPIALVPTLKESAKIALAGCIGTFVADIIAVVTLNYEMRGHPAAPAPDVSAHQVLMSFGNLALAYAAAIVVPDLQRQHSEPSRMPRVILLSLLLVSGFFLALAVTGYVAGGCQLSGNILFSIASPSDPLAASTLGFTAARGAVIMAYLFMQMHITIAFSTLLQPAFYMAERLVLGMHKDTFGAMDNLGDVLDIDANDKVPYGLVSTPSTASDTTATDLESDTERSSPHQLEEVVEEYAKTPNNVRYALLRVGMIAVLAAVSIALRDHFLDLVDFTGATFITVCCLIVPLVLYLRVLWRKLPYWERGLALTIITICAAVGVYVMTYAGKNLFRPDDSSATFPYCSDAYQNEPYFDAAS
jgi:vesicular inhibitory amino acid transporter